MTQSSTAVLRSFLSSLKSADTSLSKRFTKSAVPKAPRWVLQDGGRFWSPPEYRLLVSCNSWGGTALAAPLGKHPEDSWAQRVLVLEKPEHEAGVAGTAVVVFERGGGQIALDLKAQGVGGAVVGEDAVGGLKQFGLELAPKPRLPKQIQKRRIGAAAQFHFRRQALFQEFTFHPIINGRVRVVFMGRIAARISAGGASLQICLLRLWLASHVHKVVPESSKGFGDSYPLRHVGERSK
jgi:hypothetical protein